MNYGVIDFYVTARPSPVPSPDLPPASVPPFSLSFPPAVSPPRLLLPIHHHQAFHSFFLPPFHFILPTTLVSLSLPLPFLHIFSSFPLCSSPHLPSFFLLLSFLTTSLRFSPLSSPSFTSLPPTFVPHPACLHTSLSLPFPCSCLLFPPRLILLPSLPAQLSSSH